MAASQSEGRFHYLPCNHVLRLACFCGFVSKRSGEIAARQDGRKSKLSNGTKMAAVGGGKDEIRRRELRRFFAISGRLIDARFDKNIFFGDF